MMWWRLIIVLRHHHVIVARHIRHHVMGFWRVKTRFEIAGLRDRLKPKGERGNQPEQGRDSAEH